MKAALPSGMVQLNYSFVLFVPNFINAFPILFTRHTDSVQTELPNLIRLGNDGRKMTDVVPRFGHEQSGQPARRRAA